MQQQRDSMHSRATARMALVRRAAPPPATPAAALAAADRISLAHPDAQGVHRLRSLGPFQGAGRGALLVRPTLRLGVLVAGALVVQV